MEGEVGHRDMEKRTDKEGGVQRRGQNGAGLPSQPVGNPGISGQDEKYHNRRP